MVLPLFNNRSRAEIKALCSLNSNKVFAVDNTAKNIESLTAENGERLTAENGESLTAENF